MQYTAEEIAAVVDCHPAEVDELRTLGIIDVAAGLLLVYPDHQTPCWVVVNPVVGDALDALRALDELPLLIEELRPVWALSMLF